MKRTIIHSILSLFSNQDLIEQIEMRRQMGAEV